MWTFLINPGNVRERLSGLGIMTQHFSCCFILRFVVVVYWGMQIETLGPIAATRFEGTFSRNNKYSIKHFRLFTEQSKRSTILSSVFEVRYFLIVKYDVANL